MKLFSLLILVFALVSVVIALPPERGACCTTKSATNCIESQLINDCMSKFSGVYLGDNSHCSAEVCHALPGACCSAHDDSCRDNVAFMHCSTSDFQFAGFGTKCNSDLTCPGSAASNDGVITTEVHIIGRVRDSKTRKFLQHSVVVVMSREHVRIAESTTNSNGEYRITLPASEVTEDHAPFTVVLSEKEARNDKKQRCSRSPQHSPSPLTFNEIKSASKKSFVRNLEALCGGNLAAHSSHAKLQTQLNRVDITGDLKSVNSRHVNHEPSEETIDEHEQHHPEFTRDDDDDSSTTTSDSSEFSHSHGVHHGGGGHHNDDDDDNSHGHGHGHGHHGDDDNTAAIVIGVIIGLLLLCCLIGLCVWAYNSGTATTKTAAQYFGKQQSQLGMAIQSRKMNY